MDNEQFQQQIIEKERFNPFVSLTHNGKKVHYNTVSAVTLWRVQTMFSKEPDTIAWISSFEEGEVLVDIGANVGMYTIWAAVTRGVQVHAFEPESFNYALINKNIMINNLADKVKAYPIALSDVTAFDVLNLGEVVAGGSNHTFGSETDHNLQHRAAVYRQGCFAMPLDAVLESGGVPAPHYIKIDVDGIEHKVVDGMLKALQSPTLKSVLIELNTNLPEHQNIIKIMQDASLNFNQAEVNMSLALQKGGKFDGVANYIFRRERI